MRWKSYDSEGVEVAEGSTTSSAREITNAIPTHGSISFLLPINNTWLSLLTSEWLTVKKGNSPVTWKTFEGG